MKKVLFILLFFQNIILFSQNLEETIYVATETFINNQNETSLQLLNKQESSFKTQVKTKNEQLALVFLQCNKGYYLDQNLKLKEAITTYEEASKRFNENDLSKLSDFDLIENCLNPLGNLYTKTDDFTNALNTINQYIFLAEKSKNTKHQISGSINLAILYQTIGEHDLVFKIIGDALKIPGVSNTQKEQLLSIKTNSLIALDKNEGASALNTNSSSSKFNKYKTDYSIELKKGNYNNAFNAFKKAKEYIHEANLSIRYTVKFYVEEAQIYFLLNKTENAFLSLKQALKILLPDFGSDGLPEKTDLYPENTFIDIFDLYAEIETNPERVLQSFDLSFYVSDLLKASWTSQETKNLNETNNRKRSEKCIDILYNLHYETKDKSLLVKAFHYSEKNKVSSLKEVFLKKIRLQQSPNDSLLIKEFNLLKTQEHITNELIKEQLGTNQASKINDLSKQLSAISIQLKTLKTAISKKPPEGDSYFSLETLQEQLLKDGAVFIEYFYGAHTIYQFVISKNDIQLNQIVLNDETKKQILNFVHLFDEASIINNDISNFTSQAFQLFELLNFSVISGHQNAVIIPDGLLNFVPFESLLTSQTSSTSFSKMPFVVQNQNIIYNSSVLFYLIENQKINSNNLLGFFPVFENSNKKLTYSINEAEAIESKMKSTLFMNDKATKNNFLENVSNYSVLHLSTHASSGDFTTASNIDFYDDTLYLNELYSLNLNTNLVVLSACETGIGKLYKGEGAMSIARGFQYAGAENLLFSLWQINDLSTSQIMQSFYENYNDTKSVSYSNRQSKLDYLQNADISNIKKSPYYWGAFVYYGELTKPKESNTLFYITLGVLILLIIVFLLLKFKNYHGKDIARISS